MLLGGGERMLEGIRDDLHGLRPVRAIVAPGVTHLTFARD
jgi:hypothetical protein